MNTAKKVQKRQKRIKHIRKKILNRALSPRVAVHRSNKHIYAQVIDDMMHKTLLGTSDFNIESKKGLKKTEVAEKVGEKLARLAKEKKIEKVVFDRRGFKYHGRVKALAEGLRKEGLIF